MKKSGLFKLLQENIKTPENITLGMVRKMLAQGDGRVTYQLPMYRIVTARDKALEKKFIKKVENGEIDIIKYHKLSAQNFPSVKMIAILNRPWLANLQFPAFVYNGKGKAHGLWACPFGYDSWLLVAHTKENPGLKVPELDALKCLEIRISRPFDRSMKVGK